MTTVRLKQELYSYAHTFWSCVLLALVLGVYLDKVTRV